MFVFGVDPGPEERRDRGREGAAPQQGEGAGGPCHQTGEEM